MLRPRKPRNFHAPPAVARAQEAKCWELRTAVSLARVLAKQERRKEACTMLAEIYGCLHRGLDTADLKDTKVLGTNLPNSNRRPPQVTRRSASATLRRTADRAGI